MHIVSLFITNAKAAELVEPGEGSFYHPTPSAQPAAMFGVWLGEPRLDSTNFQGLPDCFRVITAITYQTSRTTARTPSFSL
jgi:hypothetical protein